MKREEAIQRLKANRDAMYFPETIEALDMAIEALEQEPVCEHFYKGYCSRFEDGCFQQCQAEPKHGHWIERAKCEYRCDQCGKIVFADDENELNYCCCCGAKMSRYEW